VKILTTEKAMMLVEGMKTLRVIEKKMGDNQADIQRYASQVSSERPYFETEDKQKSEVKKLVQSNTDLLKRYLALKQRIEYTNLVTIVEMNGENYSLSELLVIQRKLAAMMFATYSALNDNQGNARLRNTPAQQGVPAPHVVRFYNEEEKREGARKWQDLMNNIITRLEVINATTPLLDLPSRQTISSEKTY
jgi:hypothetical protein